MTAMDVGGRLTRRIGSIERDDMPAIKEFWFGSTVWGVIALAGWASFPHVSCVCPIERIPESAQADHESSRCEMPCCKAGGASCCCCGRTNAPLARSNQGRRPLELHCPCEVAIAAPIAAPVPSSVHAPVSVDLAFGQSFIPCITVAVKLSVQADRLDVKPPPDIVISLHTLLI